MAGPSILGIVFAVWRAHLALRPDSTAGYVIKEPLTLASMPSSLVLGLKVLLGTPDFFLLDRRALDAFRQFSESNVSIMALITWMGFRQASITYDKQARIHGRSGWNLEKKLKLVLDSVTSFTYLPIRMMSYLGFIVSVLGFLYAGWVIVNALIGRPAYGWSSLMVVVLVIGGVQMLMMGVLGEYLWRTLDETRRRPQYLIEARFDRESAGDRESG